MLIEALIDQYKRLRETKPHKTPAWGWSLSRVVGKIVLNNDGEIINLIPSEDKTGWKMIVPQQERRGNTPKPYLLCDTLSYLLGTKTDRWEATKSLHTNFLRNVDSIAAKAAVKFFENWNPEDEHPVLNDYAKLLENPSKFVLCLGTTPIFEDSAVAKEIDKNWHPDKEKAKIAKSIISGKEGLCAAVHPAIYGIKDASPAGVSLVNFSTQSFEAYGEAESRGLNAPMLLEEAHAYGTALNMMLEDERHRSWLGDITLVYWCKEEDKNNNCSLLKNLMEGNFTGDDNSKDELKLAAIIDKLKQGIVPSNVDLDADFYIVGFVPNQTRVMIKFMWRNSFKTIISNLIDYYDKTAVDMADKNRSPYVRPWFCIKATQGPHAKGSCDKTANNRFEMLMSCALESTPYPTIVYQNMILRSFAERNITQDRAAIARGYLTSTTEDGKEKFTQGINLKNSDKAYLLGRAFRLIEKIQKDADPNNASCIKDSALKSCATHPKISFTQISNRYNYYLKKLGKTKPGLAKKHKTELKTIFDSIGDLPMTLTQKEQGEFILGYFQEESYLFTPTEK